MTFPNQLADPKPLRFVFAKAGGTLTLLFVLCLLPRALMAWRVDSLCGDGTFYLHKAQRLESGLDRRATDQYDLNVYPLLLAALHRTGLDWEIAAKLWGVLASSLAVLPLFGWARRVFDERIALLSGVLYAAHPKLIEWSPELIRDPTFWLLFTLSLYCLWRAVTEVRPAWFAAGGLATFFAIQTRFEGWFLLIPLVAWCFWRLITLRQGRAKLCAGLGIFTLCYPMVLALLIYCHGYERWEWGSFHRLRLVWSALRPQTVPVDSHANMDAAPPPEPGSLDEALAIAAATPQEPVQNDASPAAHRHVLPLTSEAARVTWHVADKIGAAFSPVFGLLALFGLVRWWRMCLRVDQIPLLLLAITTVAAVWFHATVAQLSSTRYLLPLVILAMPLTALGLLPVCRSLAKWAAWAVPRRQVAPYLAASAALFVVIVAGTADALTSRGTGNTAKAELGRWLRERHGSRPLIVGSHNWGLVAHYAEAEYHSLPLRLHDMSPRTFRELLADKMPQYIILSRQGQSEAHLGAMVGAATALGLQPVSDGALPALCRGKVTVLRRMH